MSKPELQELEINGWPLKVRPPLGPGPHRVGLLLHGWTGDENSMWVFGNQLPEDYLLVAPRAPYPSNHPKYGGYTWVRKPSGEWSWLDDFRPVIAELDALLDNLARHYVADFSKINLAGFSQGAACSYAYTMLHRPRIARLAGLAGFLPENCEAALTPDLLAGLPVLIAHGNRDESVPIEKAYKARDLLTEAGARVSFCESEVGHSLGANCMRAFNKFFG